MPVMYCSAVVKRVWLVCIALVCSLVTVAQESRPSPPASTRGLIGGSEVIINYSSPGIKNRTIGKDIVPYGQVWRTGANEATTITFPQDVLLEGQPVKAGTYSLFTIPNETEWIIILNNVAKQWGAFKYDQAQDIVRVKVKPEKMKFPEERMKFEIKTKGKRGGLITLKWGNVAVPFSVKAAPAVVARNITS